MIDFTLTPTPNHLADLRGWLEDEKRVTGWSFICNWSIIQRAFESQDLFCITEDGDAVAFAAFNRLTTLAVLDVACVRHDRRKQGIGRKLATDALHALVQLGVAVVELQCKPPESEAFWRRVGFHDLDALHRLEHGFSPVQMMKYLTERLAPVEHPATANFIELWDRQFPDGPPTWTWELPSSDAGFISLPVPIVHPCDRDWKIRLVVDGKTEFQDKVKRLLSDRSAARDGYLHLANFCLEDVGA